MSFAKPVAAPDEPKQYIVVVGNPRDKFEQSVDQKLAEGWHLQGGVYFQPGISGGYLQAMVK